MLVRFEEIKDSDIVLVVDELGKYLGKTRIDMLYDCIIDDKEPIEEDEYTFWFVNKDELNKIL